MVFTQMIFVWLFIRYVYGTFDITSITTNVNESETSVNLDFEPYTTFESYLTFDVTNKTIIQTVQQLYLQNTQVNNSTIITEPISQIVLQEATAAGQDISDALDTTIIPDINSTYLTDLIQITSINTIPASNYLANVIDKTVFLEETRVNQEATAVRQDVSYSLETTTIASKHSSYLIDLIQITSLNSIPASNYLASANVLDKTVFLEETRVNQEATAAGQDVSYSLDTTTIASKNSSYLIDLIQITSLNSSPASNYLASANVLDKIVFLEETRVNQEATAAGQDISYSLGTTTIASKNSSYLIDFIQVLSLNSSSVFNFLSSVNVLNKTEPFEETSIGQRVQATSQLIKDISSPNPTLDKNSTYLMDLVQTISLNSNPASSVLSSVNKTVLLGETAVDSSTLSKQIDNSNLRLSNFDFIAFSTLSSTPSAIFVSTPSIIMVSTTSVHPTPSHTISTNQSKTNSNASVTFLEETPFLGVSNSSFGNVASLVTSLQSSLSIKYKSFSFYFSNEDTNSQIQNDSRVANSNSSFTQRIFHSENSIAPVINQTMLTLSNFSTGVSFHPYSSNTVAPTTSSMINVSKVFKIVYYCDFDETVAALGGFLPAQNIFCKSWLFVNLSVSLNCSIFPGSIVVVIQMTGSVSDYEQYKNYIVSFITNGTLNIKVNNDSIQPDEDSFSIDEIKVFKNNESFNPSRSLGRSYTSIVVSLVIAVACIAIIIIVFISKRKKWKTNVSPINSSKILQQIPPSYNTAQEGIRNEQGIMNRVFEEEN